MEATYTHLYRTAKLVQYNQYEHELWISGRLHFKCELILRPQPSTRAFKGINAIHETKDSRGSLCVSLSNLIKRSIQVIPPTAYRVLLGGF